MTEVYVWIYIDGYHVFNCGWILLFHHERACAKRVFVMHHTLSVPVWFGSWLPHGSILNHFQLQSSGNLNTVIWVRNESVWWFSMPTGYSLMLWTFLLCLIILRFEHFKLVSVGSELVRGHSEGHTVSSTPYFMVL